MYIYSYYKSIIMNHSSSTGTVKRKKCGDRHYKWGNKRHTDFSSFSLSYKEETFLVRIKSKWRVESSLKRTHPEHEITIISNVNIFLYKQDVISLYYLDNSNKMVYYNS